MNRLICFQHPSYSGKDSPELSCKMCCKIFVQAIKAEQNSKKDGNTVSSQDDTRVWLQQKIDEAKTAIQNYSNSNSQSVR